MQKMKKMTVIRQVFSEKKIDFIIKLISDKLINS